MSRDARTAEIARQPLGDRRTLDDCTSCGYRACVSWFRHRTIFAIRIEWSCSVCGAKGGSS